MFSFAVVTGFWNSRHRNRSGRPKIVLTLCQVARWLPAQCAESLQLFRPWRGIFLFGALRKLRCVGLDMAVISSFGSPNLWEGRAGRLFGGKFGPDVRNFTVQILARDCPVPFDCHRCMLGRTCPQMSTNHGIIQQDVQYGVAIFGGYRHRRTEMTEETVNMEVKQP